MFYFLLLCGASGALEPVLYMSVLVIMNFLHCSTYFYKKIIERVVETIYSMHFKVGNQKISATVIVKWDPPPDGWHKLNTDGAIKGN